MNLKERSITLGAPFQFHRNQDQLVSLSIEASQHFSQTCNKKSENMHSTNRLDDTLAK